MGGSREGHAIRPDVGLPHLSEDWKVPARWALTNPSAVRSEATKARATDKGWPWPEPSRGQLTASGRSNLLPEVAVPWRRASVSPEAAGQRGVAGLPEVDPESKALGKRWRRSQLSPGEPVPKAHPQPQHRWLYKACARQGAEIAACLLPRPSTRPGVARAEEELQPASGLGAVHTNPTAARAPVLPEKPPLSSPRRAATATHTRGRVLAAACGRASGPRCQGPRRGC